jgi:4-hydroxy-3-methylbut-2-enyl diphosphate reductase
MRLALAKTAGFCYGVRRAVAICERAARERPGAVMLGPVIHNSGVIARLETMGVKVVRSAREAPRGAPVVIRSHGVGGDEYAALRERGAEIIDATCPNVSRIHNIVREEASEGRLPIIIGRREHPEVTAIAGWCGRCAVLQSPGELAQWLGAAPENRRGAFSIVFQTTVTRELFSLCGEIIKKECTNYRIFDTICIATCKRQREAAQLAENADAMIVIGGRNSANSRRLAEICEAKCARVVFIETAGELDAAVFADCSTVGITAGASTPACNIKEVIQKMSEELRLDGIIEGTEIPSTAEDAGVAVDDPDGEVGGQTEAGPETTASAGRVFESGEETRAADVSGLGTHPAQTESGAPDTAETEDIAIGAGNTEAEDNAADVIGADVAEPDVDSEVTFEEMLEKSIKTIHTGQRVKGTVIAVTATEVTVDLGTKQSAYIPISELTDQSGGDAEESIKIGDEIEVFVARVNDVEGTVMLSKRRLNAIKNWETIESALANKTVIEGNVTEDNSGGLVVMVRGVRVFVPASQSGVPRGTPLATLVNTRVRLLVTEADADRGRVVGSIRAAERQERRARAAVLWEEIEPGKQYTGKVRSLTSFGAFVDVGGADGLLHVSELSWRRIRKPEDVLSVGDEIEVTVISVDKEKKKISLRYRKEEDNPWTAFLAAHSVGDVVSVRIVKLMTFGAFAEIMPNVDGLIHISQISDERVEVVAGALSVGQVVDVKIIDIDEERKRISLSIRALLEEPPLRTSSEGTPPLPEDGAESEDDGGTDDYYDRTPVVVYDTSAPPESVETEDDVTPVTADGTGAAPENLEESDV